jgi:hypothetical protein
MKKIKLTVAAFLLVLAVVSVLILPAIVAIGLPPVYSNSFVGVLDEKVERLASIEGKKIVVVGGSSVAFGLDSALMEEYLGMPVVNFGLYAAIGTKAMLELSLASCKVAALKPNASLPFWLPAMDWKIRSQGAPCRTAVICAVT